jgi:hypothetical protein
MKKQSQLERLTVLVSADEIKLIKHLAVERRESTSQIVRTAVGDWLARDQSLKDGRPSDVNPR